MSNTIISLCMIVRNEETDLPRCLASAQGIFDEIVVVDTGSGDRTPEIARAFGARVYEFLWQGDFAAARNHSLDLARGDWIMYLDADEELHHDDRRAIRESIGCESGTEGYLVRILNHTGQYEQRSVEVSTAVRVFRNRPEHRFSGRLHEQIGETILRHTPRSIAVSPIRIRHYGYLDGVTEGKGKRERNLPIAMEQAAAHPDDAFVQFNLAVEYHRLRRYEEALAHYRLAAANLPPGTMWGSKLFKAATLSLIKLNRLDESLVEAARGLVLFPDYTDLVYLCGVIFFLQKGYPFAVAAFQRCLAMGDAPVPPHAAAEEGMGGMRACFALGQVYEETQHFVEAINAYQAAFVSGAGAWLLPLQRIAAIVIPREDPPAVRGYFERFFDLTQASHLISLADILYQGGGPSLALAYIDRAREAGAAAEEIAVRRGLCYVKMGEYRQALEAFAEVPSDSVNFRLVALYRCFCHLNLDQDGKAHALLSELGVGEEDGRFVERLFMIKAGDALEAGLRRFPASPALAEEVARVRAQLARS